MDILRYNNGLDINLGPYNVAENESLSVDKQTVRGYLIDFMASKSCTVNNMIAFKTETENNVITDLCGNLDSSKKIADSEDGASMTDFLKAVVSAKSKYGLNAISWDSLDPTLILSKLAKRFLADFNFHTLPLFFYIPINCFQ